MDRTGLAFIILAVLLVGGLFAYSSWDQTEFAAARTETEIRLDRQPDLVEAALETGMTVSAKVIGGAIVSLLVAIIMFAYQQARINDLKSGGWERFWKRRQPQSPARRKKADLQELLTLMMIEKMSNKDRR